MLLPEFTTKELKVGSGSIIGKNNIEQFLNFVRRSDDFEDRSLVELAHNYEIAIASLVHMLEARFVNLNPIMQQMFLKLYDMEDGEKKDHVVKTLFKEFDDVAKEARKIFAKYKKLYSYTDVIGTLEAVAKDRAKYHRSNIDKNEVEIPIPFKLIGMHEALEKNFDWIVPENPFDESSVPKRSEKGNSETYIDSIHCIIEKTSELSFDNT